MMKDMMRVEVHNQLFWVIVCGLFIAAAGLIFWWNYSFDQEQKKLFGDVNMGVTRPPRQMLDTALWKVYENKKFGFSFRYPLELQAFPCYGQMLFCLNIGEKNLAFQDNGFAVRIYDAVKLQSRDETGFAERSMNGVAWRMKQDTARALRTNFGSNMQIRIFATSSYYMLDSVVATFAFTK